MNKICWKCGKNIESLPEGKLSVRELCPHCQAYLHCCRNCKFHKYGMNNECMIPGTETIKDREASNFCDEFSPKWQGPSKTVDLKEIERRLFGD